MSYPKGPWEVALMDWVDFHCEEQDIEGDTPVLSGSN